MPKPDQTLDDILDQIAKGLTGPAPEPASKPDPKQTREHIAEVSKNARATWFGLLGYLAFAVLALMSFSDQDFFIANAAIKLPFVGIEVPPIRYIWVAPPLLLVVHIYLHVHLMKLWAALPRLAAHFPKSAAQSEELSEHVYPWLIADFALRRGKSPLLQHHALSHLEHVSANQIQDSHGALFVIPSA